MRGRDSEVIGRVLGARRRTHAAGEKEGAIGAAIYFLFGIGVFLCQNKIPGLHLVYYRQFCSSMNIQQWGSHVTATEHGGEEVEKLKRNVKSRKGEEDNRIIRVVPLA